MRNILILMLLMICLPGIFINPVFSCTMVMVAKDDVILAGNNEDYNNPETSNIFDLKRKKNGARQIISD